MAEAPLLWAVGSSMRRTEAQGGFSGRVRGNIGGGDFSGSEDGLLSPSASEGSTQVSMGSGGGLVQDDDDELSDLDEDEEASSDNEF
eukprot:scaffold130983_cov37-Prasinocladus_malaysianus.AAC.2